MRTSCKFVFRTVYQGTHACADTPVQYMTMRSPNRAVTSMRRSSHEGVVQVPGISRGSVGSTGSGGLTPSAAEALLEHSGSPEYAQGLDLPGHHQLYAVPEAGESRAHMAGTGTEGDPDMEVSASGDAGGVVSVVGAVPVADLEGGPQSQAGDDAEEVPQEFHTMEGTPKEGE